MSQSTHSAESLSLLVRDAQGEYRPATGDEVLTAARQVLGRRVRRGSSLSSPDVVRDYLRTKLGALEHEIFASLLLDSQNRLIEYAEAQVTGPGNELETRRAPVLARDRARYPPRD